MYITGIWCLMGGGCRLAYVKSLMDLKDLTSERAVALLVLTAQNNAHTITSTPHESPVGARGKFRSPPPRP